MGSVVYRFMPCNRAAGAVLTRLDAAADVCPGGRRGRTDR
jgi:hypothetical protein